MSQGQAREREQDGEGRVETESVSGEAPTCRQVASEQLPSEAERGACDQFVYLVSHELRGPLATLIGYAQLLERETLPAPLKAKAVHSVIRSAKRLNGMIENLLQASRVAGGKLQIEHKHVNLVEILERVFAEYRAAQRVELSVQNRPSLVVDGDGPLLALAIDNLVSNAVKFSPEGTPVRVTLRRSGTNAVIAVQDAGPGIPGSDIDRLFEPYRTKPPGSAKPGLGVGLYVTRGIVEAHGGKIAVNSVVGKGSTFVVSLPVA